LLSTARVRYLLSLALFLLMLAIAPAQPRNHFDPLQVKSKGYPGQIPLPLLGLQAQGNQLPGIWMCKDKNGATVFSNRTWQYGECRPYVASPGLREEFLEEMFLKRKQHTPQHVIPDQSNTKSNVFGPL
jgi:hypothetical protein